MFPRLLAPLVLVLSISSAWSPALACTSPYMGSVTSVVPRPQSTDVPLNALIVVRSETIHMGDAPPLDNRFGLPRDQITLVEQDTGATVAGSIETIRGGPGRYATWEPLMELRFTPAQKLKPNTRYTVKELPGYSFTTGTASETHALESFAGVEQVELTEVAKARYDLCMSEVHIGMCPDELHVGWTYPVHARLSFTPLQHPRHGTWAHRYRVVKVDEEQPVMDFIPNDPGDNTIDFVFEYAEGCYKIVAIALDGTTLDNEQVVCLRLDQAQTIPRRELPDTTEMFCDAESGRWIKPGAPPDHEEDPPPSTTVPPDSDPPGVSTQDADDDGAATRRSGCALAAEPSTQPLLWLALLLWARRRSGRS